MTAPNDTPTPRKDRPLARYDRPTPETDAFMLQIDDSEIDLTQVRARLSDLECQRDSGEEWIATLETESARRLALLKRARYELEIILGVDSALISDIDAEGRE